MITGTLEPVTSGKTWTETLFLTDENGVAIAQSLLGTLTFLVAIKAVESRDQYGSTGDIQVLDEGTISWAMPISLSQGQYRVTVDVSDASPAGSERIAEFILPVMRD